MGKLYWKLERLIDPGVVSSQYAYKKTLERYTDSHTRWLDVGCGHSIFADWIPGQEELLAKVEIVVGMDYTADGLRRHRTISRLVAADLAAAPFAQAAFNLVTANMVVEHLADPAAALREILRLLRPGGYFIFHTPNLWFYQTRIASVAPQKLKNALVALGEGRHENDIFPAFYRMNTPPAIMDTAQKSGFHVAALHKLNTSNTADLFLFGPLVIVVLLIRRILRLRILENYRSNFIVVLQK